MTRPERPPLLVDLAKQVRVVYEEAVADLGENLGGLGILNLMADNFPTLPLRTLEDAIVLAGLGAKLKKRSEAAEDSPGGPNRC